MFHIHQALNCNLTLLISPATVPLVLEGLRVRAPLRC